MSTDRKTSALIPPHASSRRSFFQSVAAGFYGTALAHLHAREVAAETPRASTPHAQTPRDLLSRPPHYAPKAKAVIHLFMNGGPSQMDLFDPKAELAKRHGETYFKQIAEEVENPGAAGALMRSPFTFRRHGQCGNWVSSVLPHLAKHVDDIAIIKSMHTTNLTHEPAIYKIQSGRMQSTGPSVGAWVVYGLGSINQNLPAYIVLEDPKGLPINGVENWQSGFLPPIFQGTRFRATGSPVLNLEPAVGHPAGVVELRRELLGRLDRIHRGRRPGHGELDARIANYELAARMQLEASDVLDFRDEQPSTLELYGVGNKVTDSYGRRCLIARRLVERGVRFVQIYINHQIWDNHQQIESGLKHACGRTDQPIAGLLTDLKQRGLLEDTLVVWGGEFGRLPIAQLTGDKSVKTAGRDHNKNAMVTWMAGAGIRGGVSYGTTDELGFAAQEDRVSVQDWHATMLHLLGLDHERLVFKRNGLEDKLTSVFDTQLIEGILA